MNIKFKKLHPDAVIPTFGKPGDAGADLTSIDVKYDSERDVFVYRTGIAIEIPDGYVGLIFPRSSIYKTDLLLTNHVGVIDSGYRGEIIANFKIIATYDNIEDVDEDNGVAQASDIIEDCKYLIYRKGDRFAQLVIVPIPSIEYEEVSELSETVRGEGGFGSTGQ